MNGLPVSVRYQAKSVEGGREAVLCASANVHDWLATLDRLSLPASSVRLLLIPVSLDDPNPMGALIFNPQGSVRVAAPHCQPYYLALGKIWLPRHARLEPYLYPEELERFFDYPQQLYHPQIGFVAYDPEDIHSPADCLSMPYCRNARTWSHAIAGQTPPDELPIIELGHISLEDFFEQNNDGIGTSGITDLGKTKGIDDPKLISFIKGIGAGAVNHFTPKNAGGMVGRMRQWANEVNKDIERQRDKEIGRLLKLFETNQEEALKYALPLSGLNRSRGKSPPGGRLGRRDVRFNMGKLAGGSASDGWDLSMDAQWELQKRYREAADKAIKEGNFDRAAYIYAELLGDFHAAANALKQGKRHREAALIYQKRLNSLRQAAQALEEGGHWLEAARLYEDEKMFEKAGDLFAKMERTEDAHRCFELALRQTADPLDQSRIAMEKLGDFERAVAIVAGEWPSGRQPAKCQLRHFQLLVERQRQDDAAALIGSLRQPERRLQPLSLQLNNLVNIHSEANCGMRQMIMALSLDLSGEALSDQGTEHREANAILGQISALAPGVQLFSRDVKRYQQKTQRKEKEPRTKKAPLGEVVELTPKHQIDLSGLTLKSAQMVCVDQHLVIAFTRIKKAIVAIVVEGKCFNRVLNWADPENFEILPVDQESLMVASGNRTPTSDQGGAPIKLEMPNWLPQNRSGLCDSDDKYLAFLSNSGEAAVLSVYTRTGDLVHDIPLGFNLGMSPPRTVVYRRKEKHYFAAGEAIYQVDESGQVFPLEFDSPILSFTMSAKHKATQLAVITGQSLLKINVEKKFETVDLDTLRDHEVLDVVMTSNGCLVLLTMQEARVYVPGAVMRMAYKVNFAKEKERPIAISLTGRKSEFAVLFESGKLAEYRIP